MHSGKLYEAGRADAFKECFNTITNLVKDKEGVIKHVGEDGLIHEYLPLDVVRAYGFTLLALSGDEKMMKKLEKYEKNWQAINRLKEIGDRRVQGNGKKEEV